MLLQQRFDISKREWLYREGEVRKGHQHEDAVGGKEVFFFSLFSLRRALLPYLEQRRHLLDMMVLQLELDNFRLGRGGFNVFVQFSTRRDLHPLALFHPSRERQALYNGLVLKFGSSSPSGQ